MPPKAKAKDAAGPVERPILGRFSSHLKIGIVMYLSFYQNGILDLPIAIFSSIEMSFVTLMSIYLFTEGNEHTFCDSLKI